MRSIRSVSIALVVLAGCAADPEPASAPAPAAAEPAPIASAAVAPTSTADLAREAEDHCRVGLQHLNQGRHDEAAQAFSRAIELAPKDAFPHAARALALNHLGKSEAAVEDVSRAIELASDDEPFLLDLYAFRGSVQTELQRWSEGEEDLTRCIDHGKDEVELRLSRGTCLLELGQLERALADADSVVQRAPEGGEDHARGRGLWLRGLVHERAGRLEPALADLEAAAAAGIAHCKDDLARVRAALGR